MRRVFDCTMTCQWRGNFWREGDTVEMLDGTPLPREDCFSERPQTAFIPDKKPDNEADKEPDFEGIGDEAPANEAPAKTASRKRGKQA